MKISSLFIEMAADVARLRNDMDEAKKLVSRGMRGIEQAANAAKLALGAVTAGLGVREYVQAADAVTQLQNRLKLATGSAQAAAAAYAQLFDVAQRSRVSFTELGSTYATIARTTKELGLSQGQLMTVTEAIGNAMTISGGSAESMNAALVQLGQGLGSGTLRGEELNSVMEQTPRLAQAIADGLGITIGQLRGYAEQGRLSAEAVTRALQSQAAVLAGEVQGATLTVGQAMTQLSNATVKSMGEIDRATGASATLAAGLQGLASVVGTVGSAFASSDPAIRAGLGMLAGAGTVAGLAAVASAMGGVAGAIGIVKAAFVGLAAVAAANPIGLALLGIGAAVGGFVAYNSAVADSTEGLERRIYTLQERIKAGPSIYARDAEGMAQWQARVREMNAEVAALNRQLADKRGPQIIGSVGSGDAALARAQRAEWDKAASVRAQYLAATRSASQKLADEMDKARQAFGGMVPPEVEASIREKFIKPTAAAAGAARSAADDFTRLRDQLAGQVADGYAAAQAAAQGLNAAQADFLKLAGSDAWARLSGEQRAHVAALFDTRIAQEQAADATRALAAAQQAAGKAYADSLKPYQDAARSAQDRVAAMLEENQATALAERLNISLARAVELTAIARLREQQAAAMGDEAKVLAIQAEIDARQKLVDLMAGRDVREAADRLRQREAQEWERTWGQVSQSFTDALMQGGQSVKDYLRNLFRTLVLRPIIAPIGAGLASLFGGPAMAGQGGVGGGGFGGLGSLQNLLNPSKIFSSFGDSLAFAADSAGQWLVNNTSGYLNQLGGKLMGNAGSIGTIGSYAGGAMAGLGIGKAISGGYSAFGRTGNTAVNAGTVLGSIFGGPIGGAIGGAIGGVVNRLFGRKLKDSGIEGTFGGAAGFAGNSFEFYKGGLFSSNKTVRRALDPAMSSALAQQYEQLREGTKAMSAALGLSSTAVEAYTRKVRFSTRGLSNDQIIQKLTEQFQDMGDELAGLALGTTAYTRAGETASATLARLSASITTTNGLLGTLGLRLYDVGLAGADMASDLADRFGGLDAMTQASTAYYNTYYSAAERAQKTTDAMRSALAAVGLRMPTTTGQLRAMVQGLDLNTEAGRAAYAALVQLAPEFAALQDELRRLAAESAARLIETFTARGQLVPVLGDVAAALRGTTAVAGDFAGPVNTIHRLLGDAASGVLVFGDRVATTTAALDPAQLAVLGLQNQVLDLRNAASGAVVDMQGLSAALRGVDTHTFVATVTGVFELIGQRVKATLGQIADERVAVREAAMGILNPGTMSAAQIRQQIAGTALKLPTTGGIEAAQRALAAADQLVGNNTRALDTARQAQARTHEAVRVAEENVNARWNLERLARNATGNWNNDASFRKIFGWKGVTGPSNLDGLHGLDLTGFIDRLVNIDPNTVAFSSKGRGGWNSVRDPYLQARNQANSAVLGNDWWTLQQEASRKVEENNRAVWAVNASQSNLTQSLAAQAAAAQQAQQAQLDYVASLQAYSVNAAKAVTQLGRLRGETVKYYEAQQQLAGLMTGTATGLRDAVAQYRFDQMDPAAQLASLQERYNVAYSMALSTSGQTLAGYGQQMQQLLAPLLAKAQEAGLSGTQYSGMVSTMLARAEAVAKRLDDLAPKGYEEESLGLLGQIDSTLAALEAGTKTADQLIVDAVNASKDTTRDGLRAVVAALTGKPVPAFAAGGLHAGGWRIVGERGPEMEYTGPSRIFNARDTAGMFAGGDNTALLRELQALRAEVAGLRRDTVPLQAQAVVNTGRAVRQMERWDGSGLPVVNAEGTTLTTA